ncbi:hypothetical protein [Winogradskyella sp. A3E31]|uniref:hypothetical protein n=1 Tax=Winogradskyella sp. A3E31 TaxID=3349637 RepID=UPI00398B21E3
MKFKLYIVLVLLLVIPNKIFPQTNSIFNDYHKLSFQFGASRYTGSETSTIPSTLKYKFRDFTSPHFGFYYDLLQTDNFNFKLGFSTLLVRDWEEYGIKAEEIPSVDSSRDFYVEGAGSWRFNLPLTTEYLIDLGKNKLFISSSLIIGYSKEYGNTVAQYGIKAPNESEFTTIDRVYRRQTAPWYANVQFGVGMYFPFEKWMLRTNVYYNFALQDLYNGTFLFSNLEQSPDTSGNFSFRGDSFGIEFSVYLKKKKK